MSRGVVCWLDPSTEHIIRSTSAQLAEHGLPALGSETHSIHRPHVSLIVADTLDPVAALDDASTVPAVPVDVLIESVAVVAGGHLLLALTPSAQLLQEQSRVHKAVRLHAGNPWPHYEPDRWFPHITLARALAPDQLGIAIPIITGVLPIDGFLATGGIEDSTTHERWTTVG